MAPAATTNPLFNFGVDLDSVDPDTGRTALHRAAMFADAEKVQLPPVHSLLGSKATLAHGVSAVPQHTHSAQLKGLLLLAASPTLRLL